MKYTSEHNPMGRKVAEYNGFNIIWLDYKGRKELLKLQMGKWVSGSKCCKY